MLQDRAACLNKINTSSKLLLQIEISAISKLNTDPDLGTKTRFNSRSNKSITQFKYIL